MNAGGAAAVDVIVAVLRSLPTEERRAVVDASGALRELSSRVPQVAREPAARLATPDAKIGSPRA